VTTHEAKQAVLHWLAANFPTVGGLHVWSKSLDGWADRVVVSVGLRPHTAGFPYAELQHFARCNGFRVVFPSDQFDPLALRVDRVEREVVGGGELAKYVHLSDGSVVVDAGGMVALYPSWASYLAEDEVRRIEYLDEPGDYFAV